MMSFKEWEKLHKEKQRSLTMGAEEIDLDHPLTDVFYVLNRICFDKMFTYIPLYWLPESMRKPKLAGVYGYGVIMLDKPYYEEHGVDEATINILYHEMLHAYAERKGIQDVDEKGKHTPDFADLTEETGGKGAYNDENEEWNIVYLSRNTMEKVQEVLEWRL